MKLSVNEAKLSGLRARNCATSQKVWSLKYGCLRVRKVTGLFEKRAPWRNVNKVYETD